MIMDIHNILESPTLPPSIIETFEAKDFGSSEKMSAFSGENKSIINEMNETLTARWLGNIWKTG